MCGGAKALTSKPVVSECIHASFWCELVCVTRSTSWSVKKVHLESERLQNPPG